MESAFDPDGDWDKFADMNPSEAPNGERAESPSSQDEWKVVDEFDYP